MVMAFSFASTDENRTFIINFESLIVKNPHDQPRETTRWDLDAYVNEERVRLNPGGQLSSISTGKEIPLGIEKEILVPVNGTIRLFTLGIDEDEQGVNRNQTASELNDAEGIVDNIELSLGSENVGKVSTSINIQKLIRTISQQFNRLAGTENDPLGVITRVFDQRNNFGVGTHHDCSQMNRDLINFIEQQKTACDFILKYTIREIGSILTENNWTVIRGKSVISNPSVVSNGPGKYDVFAIGNDGVLWHRGYDYGWKGWEPLSTYSNIPGAFVPFNSTVGVSSIFTNRLDVFAKGSDQFIWHNWRDISEGQWQNEWIPLSTVRFNSEPSTFSTLPSALSLFAIDLSNTLCVNTLNPQTSTWIGWNAMKDSECTKLTPPTVRSDFRLPETCLSIECNLLRSLQGYTLAKPPILISTSQGRIDAFALLNNNEIWHGNFTRDKFNQWHFRTNETLGQGIISQVSVVSKSNAFVDLELYAQRADGTLFRIAYNGNHWSSWQPLGKVSDGPSVVYWQDPETYSIFTRDRGSLIYTLMGMQ
jgi:hypothetical protein